MNTFQKTPPTFSSTSCKKNAFEAVRDLYDQIYTKHCAFIIIFFSDIYNQEELGTALNHFFPKIPIFGCTGCGTISCAGYQDNSILATSFSKKHFQIVLDHAFDLANYDADLSQTNFSKILNSKNSHDTSQKRETFALILNDGLSMYEEILCFQISSMLGGIPLIGGSGGDNLNFTDTRILHQGQFLKKAALLILIRTNLPIYPFSYHNFVESEQILVVTKADPQKRIIYELNGLPAVQAYSEAIGIDVKNMNAEVFANFPLAVKYKDSCYVRSIQRINADQSLTFFCAIDEGLVMRLAEKTSLRERTDRVFQDIHQKIGEPSSVMIFDCIYTKISLESSKKEYQFHEKIFSDNQCFGFNTYGEQFNSTHLNQTITGISFGKL